MLKLPYKLHTDLFDVEIDIQYDVDHDPGCWTLPNGDPGWPESTHINISNIYVNKIVFPDSACDEYKDISDDFQKFMQDMIYYNFGEDLEAACYDDWKKQRYGE